MRPVLRDLTILAVICLSVWATTRVRLHIRQLEYNRAELIYTTAIDDAKASELIEALAQHGFLNGVPRTFQIDQVDGIYQLLVVSQPTILGNPQVETLLRTGFESVCKSVFGGHQAMVKLADAKLKSFYLLVPPQRF